jgi:glucosamine 6-phosphate synthetase-like amidotransferase/phosphosugar isomerase protein
MATEQDAASVVVHKSSFEDLEEEDSATMETRDNLKHTRISDGETTEENHAEIDNHGDSIIIDKDNVNPLQAKESTPEPVEISDIRDEEMKEQLSSPKKKRLRESDDDVKDTESLDNIERDRVASNGSSTSGTRTTRSEPEKKRHRDGSEGAAEDDLEAKV